MKLSYSLAYEDFIEYQLYVHAKSKSGKKSEKLSRILIPLIYIGMAAYTVRLGAHLLLASVLTSFAIGWFFYYPKFRKMKVARYLSKFVKEHYSKRIDLESRLEIDAEGLHMQTESANSNIRLSEVDELIEIPAHFFIKLQSSMSVIIPKAAIADCELFIFELKQLGINYREDLNWRSELG